MATPRHATLYITLMIAIAAALALAPTLSYRWFYLASNFYVQSNVDNAIALLHRAAKAGYNGVVFTDSKLSSLETYPDFYVKAVDRFLTTAREEHIQVIPMVLSVAWADGMLAHNPSLVESMPCRAVELTAHNGQLQSSNEELYANGSFKDHHGDKIGGLGYQDAPGVATFVDTAIHHDSDCSLRIDDPEKAADSHGNCRIVEHVDLKPWHQYRLQMWIKTDGLDTPGSVYATILDKTGNKSLNYMGLDIQPTADWAKKTVVFNSQAESEANVYLGVWGGHKGKMWIADVSLKDAGLLNVNPGPGCHIALKSQTGATLKPGQDYGPVQDPKYGNVPWPGEFDFQHDLPSVPIPQGSQIREGDVVLADYCAATSTDVGKTAICLADPQTAKLEQAEVDRVRDLIHPDGFFLAQDEFRVGGWCDACKASGKPIADLVADDIHRSIGYLQGKKAFVWSDMFDPYHNAVSSYYLVNGSLVGTWKGLTPGTVIVNWNSGRQDESLKFFADKGFGQILAGYYDGPVDSIVPWIAKARKAGGLQGVMYTTWVGNYDNLEAFAKAAWGS